MFRERCVDLRLGMAGGIVLGQSGLGLGQISGVLQGGANGLAVLQRKLLGATLQYSGWCSKKQLVVNAPTDTSTRICGYDVLTNSQVNFLASVITSAAGALAATRLF